MGIRVSFDRGSSSHMDTMIVNAALDKAYTVADLAAYNMLEALYSESSSMDNQSLGYDRYQVLSSHPMHRFFGWEVKTYHIKDDLGINLDGNCGFSEDKAIITKILGYAGFDPAAAEYIRSISWS